MDWRKLERAVDKLERRTFGETVRLTFFKNGAVDATRPQWTGSAILHTGGDDSFTPGEGGKYRTRLAAGQAELVLTSGEYDGPIPTGKDIVRAIDREGEPRWEVSGVSDRYSNLWVLSLTQA